MGMLKYTIKNIFKKPSTVKYPYEKRETPDDFRGQIVIDVDKCTLCHFCEMQCSANAIEIDKENNAIKYKIMKCIACGECVDECPTEAMKIVPQPRKSGYDKSWKIIKVPRLEEKLERKI
jgi:ech hydrogenase subunit F